MLLRKIITTLVMPTGLLWLSLGGAALAAEKRSKLRRGLFLSWLALTVAANPVVSTLMVRVLERPYLEIRPLETTVTYDAVLVMGGGSGLSHHLEPQLNGSGDRIRLGAALASRGKATRLVTTSSSFLGNRDLSSETAALWADMGIGSERIVRVKGPMNTAQEIRALAELVRTEGWARVGLVTSGYHMRRAQALCRRNGLDADPLPADRRTRIGVLSPLSFLPQGTALAKTDQAVKEMLGLAAVYLIGG
ncbi:MAG: YdcF family protein [Acidobacteriota bacterium]|nr:YdcF family protein [Acidobacteriota bacterium]